MGNPTAWDDIQPQQIKPDRVRAIQRDYEESDLILEAIAKKHKVGVKTISRFVAKFGWQKINLTKEEQKAQKNKKTPVIATPEQTAYALELLVNGCPVGIAAKHMRFGLDVFEREFAEQIEIGKEIAAAKLGGLLYRQAMGTPAIYDPHDDPSDPFREPIVEAVPGSFPHQAFWLERSGAANGRWSRKPREVEAQVPPVINITMTQPSFTPESDKAKV